MGHEFGFAVEVGRRSQHSSRTHQDAPPPKKLNSTPQRSDQASKCLPIQSVFFSCEIPQDHRSPYSFNPHHKPEVQTQNYYRGFLEVYSVFLRFLHSEGLSRHTSLFFATAKNLKSQKPKDPGVWEGSWAKPQQEACHWV